MTDYALEVWGAKASAAARLRPINGGDGWSSYLRLGGAHSSELRDWLAERGFTMRPGNLEVYVVSAATALEIRMRWF